MIHHSFYCKTFFFFWREVARVESGYGRTEKWVRLECMMQNSQRIIKTKYGGKRTVWGQGVFRKAVLILSWF